MSLATLTRMERRGAVSKPRDKILLVEDTFTEPATVSLANHDSETGTPDVLGVAWEQHPTSAAGINVNTGKAVGGSGSSVSLFRHLNEPGTVDCTLVAKVVIDSIAPSGNSVHCFLRLDPSSATGYAVSLTFSTGPIVVFNLQKFVGGTLTNLGSQVTLSGGSLPSVGDTITLTLTCSNDEKVAYYQLPTDVSPVRFSSSGDNTVPAAGYAGLRYNRSIAGTGAHVTELTVYSNGPQEQSGVLIGSTPDPAQPAQLLWTPDYSTPTLTVGTGIPADPNGGLVPGRRWRSEQDPKVRGVVQNDRMQIVAAADVPGSGTYKPTGGALRTELRSFHVAGDVVMTATADATSSATSISVSNPTALFDKDFINNLATGEAMRVVGTPTGNPITVARGQTSTAQPITTGDSLLTPAGDVSDSGGTYQASRAEVFDRFAPGGGSSPPSSWPDPVGSVRWYGISIYIPSDFTEDSSNWFTMMQWKGQFGGSPPRALEIDGDRFNFGGTRTRRDLGSLNRGTWTRFVFGFRWEIDAINGWSTVYRDGNVVVAKQSEKTMDKHGSGADPIYLKDGIYRTKAWTVTHVTYLGPVKVGTTIDDVFNS